MRTAPHRCQNADCRNERLYWGEEKRKGEVIVTSVRLTWVQMWSAEERLPLSVPSLPASWWGCMSLNNAFKSSLVGKTDLPLSRPVVVPVPIIQHMCTPKHMPTGQQVEQRGVLEVHGVEGVLPLHVWRWLRLFLRHSPRPAPDPPGERPWRAADGSMGDTALLLVDGALAGLEKSRSLLGMFDPHLPAPHHPPSTP